MIQVLKRGFLLLCCYFIFFRAEGQILKNNQFISFGQISNKSCLDSVFTLSVTASSGLAITYDISGPAILSGDTVKLKKVVFKPGLTQTTVIITAYQNGDDNYNAATPVQRTFDIKPDFLDSLNENVLVSMQPFYCEGDTLIIAPIDLQDVKYEWIYLDNSSHISKNLVLNNVNTSNMGAYNLNIYKGVCMLEKNNIQVNIHPKPKIACKNIVDTIQTNSLPFRLVFEPAGGQFLINNIMQTDDVFNYTIPGIYGLNYSVSENGCTNNYTSDIYLKEARTGEVSTDSIITIYKIITPNYDKKNDFFQIDNIEKYIDNHVVVFDYWGNTVYQSSNYNNTWSPTDVANGNYLYVLTINKPSIKKITGNLLITR